MEVMTAASTGAGAMGGEVDGPQVVWNVEEAAAVEEAMDSMPPKEARYNFRSATTLYPGFAGRWTPDAHLQFCGKQEQIPGRQGQGNDNSDVCTFLSASRSISQLGKGTGLGQWVFAAG